MSKNNPRRRKNQFFNIVATMMIVFSMMAYQIALPLSFSMAAEKIIEEVPEKISEPEPEPESEDVVEEEPEPEEIIKEEPVEEADESEEIIEEDESESLTPAEGEDGDPTAELVGQDEETADGEIAEDSQELTEVPAITVEDPGEGSDTSIENENNADVENNIEAGADTGNNDANCNGQNEDEKEQGSELEQESEPVVEENICDDNEDQLQKDVLIVDDQSSDNREESEDLDEEEGEGEGESLTPAEGEDRGPTAELVGQDEETAGNNENAEEGNETTIDTGDAVAVVDVINDVNTNIVGNNWIDEFINLYGEYDGDISLLELFIAMLENVASEENSENSSSDSSRGTVDINNENNADINNNVEVNVNTGKNEANDNGGDTGITTGDATAIVNIINLINRNIVGDNWLFAMINVFGSWTGDLIVPGEGLLDIPQSDGCFDDCLGGDNVNISNENNADVENNVEVNVNTGKNEANDNGGNASITTGDATADVDVVNMVNQNVVGNNWFFLMVNNMGSWVGNILNWNSTANAYENVFSYEFGSLEGDEKADESGGSLAISNENNADVENNVEVNVNTGKNEANDNGGDASIRTGDAGAWVNVFNFVNNNIIGNNWMFGIVNVMGSWAGDVIFAYPDLKISIDDGKSTAGPGEQLTYTVRYENIGKADAENVELMISLPEKISYDSDTAGSGHSTDGNNLVWNLGFLESEESGVFNVEVLIDSEVSDGTLLASAAGIKTETAENELGNNSSSDETVIVVSEESNQPEQYTVTYLDDNSGNNINEEGDDDYKLKIKRDSSITNPVYSGDVVSHTIIIKNDSDGPLYDVEVRDKMKNSGGGTILTYSWPIGDLEKGDKIMIEYELLVNGNASEGEYDYVAKAYGYNWEDDEVKSRKVSSHMVVAASVAGAYYAPGESESIIPIAEAANVTPKGIGSVLGVDICATLPFWIWLMSILAYLLIINWSLFPKPKNN